MKCIVRKLKAEISNSSLPVFEEIVMKNYITTTQDGQCVEIAGSFALNASKIDAVFETTIVNSTKPLIVAAIAMTQTILVKQSWGRVQNTSDGTLVPIQANTEISAGLDGSDGGYYVNETAGNCSSPYTGTTVKNAVYCFGHPERADFANESKAGAIKIKSVKFTDQNNNEYLLKPAEVNGVAVLYDEDRGVYYGERNGGDLVCG